MNFLEEELFRVLENNLPPIFTRETASKILGGLFSARTLSNFDAAGNGPRKKIHIGKKVAYERKDFLDWLERMISGKTIKRKRENRQFYMY